MSESGGGGKVRFDLKKVAQFDKQNQLELYRKGKYQSKKSKSRPNVFQDDGYDEDKRDVQSNYRDRAVERRRQEQGLDIYKLHDEDVKSDIESESEDDEEQEDKNFQEVKGLDFSLLAKIRAQTDAALKDLQSKGLLKPSLAVTDNLQDDDREEIAELRRKKMQTSTKMGANIRKLLFPDSVEAIPSSTIGNKASQMIARTVLVFDHSQPLPRSLLLSGRTATHTDTVPSCLHRDDYHISPALLHKLQTAMNKPKAVSKAVKVVSIAPPPVVASASSSSSKPTIASIYDDEEVMQGEYIPLPLAEDTQPPSANGYTAAVIFNDDDDSSSSQQQKVKGLFSFRGSYANNIFAPAPSSSSAPQVSTLPIFSSSFKKPAKSSQQPAAKATAASSSSSSKQQEGVVHRDIFLGTAAPLSASEQRKQQKATAKRKLQQAEADEEKDRDYYEGDAYDLAYASDEDTGEGGKAGGKGKRKRSSGKGGGSGSP